MYGEDQACAQRSIVSEEEYLRNKALGNPINGVAETELSSLLSTLLQQAREARGITVSILQRVAPQEEEGDADKPSFSYGYIGRAEEVRSTLSETIRLLGTLSKLA